MSNERLVTKVCFPRLALPLAAVLVGLVDFAVAFGVIVAMIYYGIVTGAGILALPPLLALRSGRSRFGRVSGAVLGMKRAEIVRKFDAIVAFAEVERFLDTQGRHYSTGMFHLPGFFSRRSPRARDPGLGRSSGGRGRELAAPST